VVSSETAILVREKGLPGYRATAIACLLACLLACMHALALLLLLLYIVDTYTPCTPPHPLLFSSAPSQSIASRHLLLLGLIACNTTAEHRLKAGWVLSEVVSFSLTTAFFWLPPKRHLTLSVLYNINCSGSLSALRSFALSFE
jgi:hypothetical protein